jgi:hypothetical protein
MNLPEFGNQQTAQVKVSEQALTLMNDDGDEVATTLF